MRFFKFPLTEKHLVQMLTGMGVVLAVLIIAQLNGRINNDATLYLEMAKRFAAADIHGALKLYNWPLFAWLMAKTHAITGLSVQYSAHLLNVVFFGVATWSFLTLIHECGGNRTTLAAGAILLFSAPYIVGDVLPMIMRDQGFWAFHLLSLLYFLRFYRSGTWCHALAWQATAMLAMLFRIEGVTFLLLLPFAVAFKHELTWRGRGLALVKVYALPLLGLAVIALVLLLMPSPDAGKLLGRILDIQSSLQIVYHQLSVGLLEKANIYGEKVLGSFMAEYAMLGLTLTLIAVVISNIAGATGWLGILLGCFVRPTSDSVPTADAREVLYWVVGLNLLNLVIIILTAFLLSGRYAIPLAFIILVFASFHLSGLYQIWLRDRHIFSGGKKAAYAAVVIVLAFYFVGNVIKRGEYPDYEQVAAAWIKQNLAQKANIYFDDARMRYYANAPWNGRLTDWADLKTALDSNRHPYDYLVLHIKHKHPEKRDLLDQYPQYRELKRFSARNGDIVLVLADTPDAAAASK